MRSPRQFVIALLALCLLGAPVIGQQPAAPVLSSTQLHQAAASQGAGVAGAMRGLISYEEQVARAMQGGANSNTIASAMRNSLAARQRLGQAMIQWIQAQGNPNNVGTAVGGGFRGLLSAEQRLINSYASANAGDDLAQAAQTRNNQQAQLNNQIQRWNATINYYLPPQTRAARAGIVSGVDGALRQLESADRQWLSVIGSASSSRNSSARSTQQQIASLEDRIASSERQLSSINRLGSTKAAQNPRASQLQRQIREDRQTLTQLQRQLSSTQQQQSASTSNRQGYALQNRVQALVQLNMALTKLMQFDAQL